MNLILNGPELNNVAALYKRINSLGQTTYQNIFLKRSIIFLCMVSGSA